MENKYEYEERPHKGTLRLTGDIDDMEYRVLDMNPIDTYDWMLPDERMFLVVVPKGRVHRLIVRGAYTLAELPGVVKVRLEKEKE